MKLACIVGPTATGKTALAISLCRKFNGEIISVDSRQAYREMEIGTGKGIQKQDEVKIHLSDVTTPDQRLTAYEFAKLVWKKIEGVEGRGKVPFLVGGTGFYLDVVLGRVGLAGVGVDEKLREELNRLTDEKLIERLKELVPERLSKIDIHNRYRVLRAIEIAWQNQRSKIKDQNQSLKVKSYQVLWLGLTAANGYLYKVADERVDRMMREGLEGEVRGLVEKYGWAAPGLKTLGYREFRPYFEKTTDLAGVIQKIKFNTHAYIRRQKTYFKRNPQIKWFDVEELGFAQRVTKEVESFLKA